MFKTRTTLLAACAALVLAACGGGDGGNTNTTTPPPTAAAEVEGAFALDTEGRLHWFDGDNPTTPAYTVMLRGLATGEYLVDIDSNPLTGALRGLGSLGTIYTIDAATGQVNAIATAAPMVPGSEFGIEFDPMSDEIIVATDADASVMIDAQTGAASNEGTLAYVAGDILFGADAYVVALARVDGVRYGIDAANDVLVRYDDTLAAGLHTVGPLGIDVASRVGFDADLEGAAWLVTHVEGLERIYAVDLTTGEATLAANVDAEAQFRGLAVAPMPTLPPVTVYAVTRGNVLVRFAADAPEAPDHSVAITGLAAGEAAIALDVRPATGQLILATDAGAIYVISPMTGEAYPLSTQATLAVGSTFGSDFQADLDSLRIVGDLGQNLAVNVTTGATTEDAAVAYAAADVNAGTAATISALAEHTTLGGLMAVDGDLDVLARLAAPATGQLLTVGPLGIDAQGELALDFEATAGALLAVEEGGLSRLYTLDSTSGAATSVGIIAAGDVVVALAIEPRHADEATSFVATASNTLLEVATQRPMEVIASVTITGMGAGEYLVALARSPIDGTVYALAQTQTLYTLDTDTGIASILLPSATDVDVDVDPFGCDVDPVDGALHLLSGVEENQSVDLLNGALLYRPDLAYAATDVQVGADATIDGAAWTGSYPGATTATLFAIDVASDTLVRVDPATGELTTVGSLGFDAEAVHGMDIRGGAARALAAVQAAGETEVTIHVIDLATGLATRIGAFATGEAITAFTCRD